GDAAGLINPLQGEGIAPAMISARLAAEAVLADPCRAGPAYTRALAEAFGHYLPGASALQRALLHRPWAASASLRLVTPPGPRRGRPRAGGQHGVDLLERPDRRRPAEAGRVGGPWPGSDRHPTSCANPGGRPPGTPRWPQGPLTSSGRLGPYWPGGNASTRLPQPARELCGLDPCSLEPDAVAGSMPGSTSVLPVGPASTAWWVALPRSSCFQVRNHWVYPSSHVPATGLPVTVIGSPGLARS